MFLQDTVQLLRELLDMTKRPLVIHIVRPCNRSDMGMLEMDLIGNERMNNTMVIGVSWKEGRLLILLQLDTSYLL